MQILYTVCLVLLIAGGINWGLVGLLQFDFVGWLFGGSTTLPARILFIVIGAAALCAIPCLFFDHCSGNHDDSAK